MNELEARSLRDREMIEQLELALESARTIGAAIGLLMASRNLTQEEAFAGLREASNLNNTKVRDLAARMLAEADATTKASRTRRATSPRKSKRAPLPRSAFGSPRAQGELS